jgi:ligand-binding SRPBCC domain-containing protein
MPVFTASIHLPRPRAQVFDFFAQAGNLGRITPPELGFEIRTPLPIAMREGTRIDYRIRLFGVPMTWQTLITVWEPGERFVDEQVAGPYRQWIHSHTFRDEEGGTRMDDEVRYELPLAPLGNVVLPLIKLQLRRIFAFRAAAVRELLKAESAAVRS